MHGSAVDNGAMNSIPALGICFRIAVRSYMKFLKGSHKMGNGLGGFSKKNSAPLSLIKTFRMNLISCSRIHFAGQYSDIHHSWYNILVINVRACLSLGWIVPVVVRIVVESVRIHGVEYIWRNVKLIRKPLYSLLNLKTCCKNIEFKKMFSSPRTKFK